ncbi:MAG: hypothetical protein AB7D09_00900, partial [Methanosarcina sp.]
MNQKCLLLKQKSSGINLGIPIKKNTGQRAAKAGRLLIGYCRAAKPPSLMPHLLKKSHVKNENRC